MIRGTKVVTWKTKGNGFAFLQERSLPSPPEPVVFGEKRSSSFFLSKDGGVFYATKESILEFANGKWEIFAKLPKALAELPREVEPTILWGTGEYLLVLGTLENMMEVYRVREGNMELIRATGFDAAGSHKFTFDRKGGAPQACVIGDACWVLFMSNGRYFRINTESGAVKELDMPWIQWKGGSQAKQGSWTRTPSGADPVEPVIPCAVQFIPEPGVSSPTILTLMYNRSPAYAYQVNCDSDGGSIEAQGNLVQDLGEMPKFRDPQGDLKGLKALSKLPARNAVPPP